MEGTGSALTLLTSTAVAVFQAKQAGQLKRPEWFPTGLGLDDPVLEVAKETSFLGLDGFPAVKEIAKTILRGPEFERIAHKEGELDAMILHPGGGSRSSPEAFIITLFSSAFLQMFFLRASWDEGTYVRTVIEGFEELRRALRGEKVRAYLIHGLAKVTLAQGKQIATPWGVIRPAPPSDPQKRFMRFGDPETKCLLAQPILYPVVFDRAPQPEHKFDDADTAPSRSSFLLPLACALASANASSPAVPVATWSTRLFPFENGLSYSWAKYGPMFAPDVALDGEITEVEDWSRTVDRAHVASLDIAARRLASAVAHRADKGDSLIDAVMAWENLLGTSQEVTFRVSASLAKLIEPDSTKRQALRKKLSDIYGIRSRLVHGSTVDATDLQKASSEAIDVAVQALRVTYKQSREWLSLNSTERSDAVLLSWD